MLVLVLSSTSWNSSTLHMYRMQAMPSSLAQFLCCLPSFLGSLPECRFFAASISVITADGRNFVVSSSPSIEWESVELKFKDTSKNSMQKCHRLHSGSCVALWTRRSVLSTIQNSQFFLEPRWDYQACSVKVYLNAYWRVCSITFAYWH